MAQFPHPCFIRRDDFLYIFSAHSRVVNSNLSLICYISVVITQNRNRPTTSMQKNTTYWKQYHIYNHTKWEATIVNTIVHFSLDQMTNYWYLKRILSSSLAINCSTNISLINLKTQTWNQFSLMNYSMVVRGFSYISR